jgi:hypothetical protein
LQGDIDLKIRQAELEYATEHEEVLLLSILKEVRKVQTELENEKLRSSSLSLYELIEKKKYQFVLCAIQVSIEKLRSIINNEHIDWQADGEGLLHDDKIIEINGYCLDGQNKDELIKMCNLIKTPMCNMVVIRRVIGSMSNANLQQLHQSQADNLKLQHRICYLEEQVKDLLDYQKERKNQTNQNVSHITSINISASNDQMIYQNTPTKSSGEGFTRYKDSVDIRNDDIAMKSVKNLSTSLSRISVSTDANLQKYRKEREKERYYGSSKSLSKNVLQT